MAGEEGGSRASATPADFVHSVTPNSGFAPRGKCLSCKIPSLPPNDPTLSVESDVLHAAPSKSPGQAARTDRSPAPRSWPGPIRPERVRRRRSPQGIESGLWGHLRLPVPQTPMPQTPMPQTPHATDPHATSRAQHRPRRVEEQTRRGRAMDRRLSRRLEQSRSARVVVARQHYSDRTRLGFWVSAREHFPYPPPPGGVPSEGRAGSRSNTDECPLRPYRPLRSERDRDRTRRRSGGRLDGRDVDSPDSQHHAE